VTTVLVADDELHILMLTAMLFEELGMTVITATDGRMALEQAKLHRPDLIITDIMMPFKTGFEVCRDVRQDPELSDTPIMIISALGDEYNKLTGFEGGADDFVTKPFNVDELKARAKALLLRRAARDHVIEATSDPIPMVSTGVPLLDEALGGGLPVASNILLLGPLGSGKSLFCRRFMASGLAKSDRCLWLALDDNPKQIRQSIQRTLPHTMLDYESLNLIRFVDAYSWSSFVSPDDEPYAVTGSLDLGQLAGLIADASGDIGHTIHHKLGGRRVVDSISSLLIHFELSMVQRFLTQISRTALALGGVTTLFVLEEGTVSDQMVNNVGYLMDGVLEFGVENDQFMIRAKTMKWTPFQTRWNRVVSPY